MIRPYAFAALVLGISSGSAVAQTRWVEVSDSTMLMPWNMSVDAVEDMDIMAGGKKVGEVEGVIGTAETTPTALVVDFDDDSGYGDRDDVVIPLENFAAANNMLTLNADASAVGGMQVWDD